MARTITGLKNIRQNAKRCARNKAVKSQVKTRVKQVLAQVEKKDRESADSALKVAYTTLDKAVAKGVLHRNNASRHKSRLAARVNAVPKKS